MSFFFFFFSGRRKTVPSSRREPSSVSVVYVDVSEGQDCVPRVTRDSVTPIIPVRLLPVSGPTRTVSGDGSLVFGDSNWETMRQGRKGFRLVGTRMEPRRALRVPVPDQNPFAARKDGRVVLRGTCVPTSLTSDLLETPSVPTLRVIPPVPSLT